jgi:hypothetical protein
VIFLLLAHNDDVVDISRGVAPQLATQNQLHHAIESWPSVMKAFWHSNETKNAEGGCEPGLSLVLPSHPHLVVFGETIQETQHLTSSCLIDDNVDPWQRVRVLRTRFVVFCEIDAHAHVPIVLQHHHHIGHPHRVLHFSYDSCIKQLLHFGLRKLDPVA